MDAKDCKLWSFAKARGWGSRKTECICKFLSGILSVCHVLKKHAATRYFSSAMKSETYLNVDRHGLKRYKVILILNCRRLQTIHFSSELYKVIQCYALLRIRTCRVLWVFLACHSIVFTSGVHALRFLWRSGANFAKAFIFLHLSICGRVSIFDPEAWSKAGYAGFRLAKAIQLEQRG